MRISLFVLPLLLAAPAAMADCPVWQAGDLSVTETWSRATIGDSRPGVFYAQIANAGMTDDALLGIATPVAAMPMLHETVVRDGVASMPHAMRIVVPAGGAVALAPGGYHGMLMELTQPLLRGESFPLILTFERAGAVTVDVAVVALAARGAECSAGGS